MKFTRERDRFICEQFSRDLSNNGRTVLLNDWNDLTEPNFILFYAVQCQELRDITLPLVR